MKFSLKWLQQLVDLNTSAEKLAAQLTDIGLEVEGIAGDVIDVAVPPNRADCLGMVGIAREAATINDILFTAPVIKEIPITIPDQIKLQVQNSKGCPKYLGRIIKNVNNTGATPQWIKDCLVNADIKTISPTVDITNYVMIEWGQPLHAFDLDKVAGGTIIVRNAAAGETLSLLDGSTKELTKDTLVIADAHKPLALGGIMGGTESAISTTSKDILIECAYFDAIEIRLCARHHGLQTDGSYRHERCIDPTMQHCVMERVTQLLLEVVGGQAGPITECVDLKHIPPVITIKLRQDRIARILGIKVPAAHVIQILRQLGMQVALGGNSEELEVTVPAFRTDLAREIDLIEEVVRIFGYANIPAQLPIGTLAFSPQPEKIVTELRILDCLINRGYNEAITYSFIAPELSKQFVPDSSTYWSITNPISADMSLMRPSLLPGLVAALQHNQNRQQARVRLFEIGLRFTGDENDLQQTKTIAGVCSGNYLTENWASPARAVDFYDLKADILALFKLGHNVASIEFKAAEDVAMHPGQCVEIIVAGVKVGKLGELHPVLKTSLDLAAAVYMFEIDYDAVANGQVANFSPFSKFPAARRDLALLVDKKVSSAKLEHAIKKIVGKLLTEVVIFDVYQGKGIDPAKQSIGLGITLQDPDRTLTDVEVNEIFQNLTTKLAYEFNATLR